MVFELLRRSCNLILLQSVFLLTVVVGIKHLKLVVLRIFLSIYILRGLKIELGRSWRLGLRGLVVV